MSMTDSTSTSPALQTSLAYYHAWTSHDLDTALTYIADDIVCLAPSGRLEGAEAFRGFMGPFAQILSSSKLIAAFGDDEKAVVMYDTTVADHLAEECRTSADGGDPPCVSRRGISVRLQGRAFGTPNTGACSPDRRQGTRIIERRCVTETGTKRGGGGATVRLRGGGHVAPSLAEALTGAPPPGRSPRFRRSTVPVVTLHR
jgi:SnoaL-like domain